MTFVRPLLLVLALLLLVGLGPGRAQDIEGVCVNCGHGMPHDYSGCACCNPGGGGDDGGYTPHDYSDGSHPLSLEIVVFPAVGPVFFAMGLGLGLAWIFLKVTGNTDQDVFQYSGFEDEQASFPILSLATGLGALTAFVLYLPVAGVEALGDLLIDDDAEASASVSEAAAEAQAEAATRHAEFVGAYPSPGPAEPVDLRHLDLVAARRAEALAAAQDVSAPPAATAPAGPTWPTTGPLVRSAARPRFEPPPPPPPGDPGPRRAAGVLERTRGLLRDGGAAARDNLVDEVKDRALGLLPDRVERALRAHLAAQEGTRSMLERVRDEGVPLLAFGSSSQLERFEGELERERVATAERVLDEAQGEEGDDRWLELLRGRR